MSAMAPESAIEVDLLVLRRDEFFLGEQERRALKRLAPQLGGNLCGRRRVRGNCVAGVEADRLAAVRWRGSASVAVRQAFRGGAAVLLEPFPRSVACVRGVCPGFYRYRCGAANAARQHSPGSLGSRGASCAGALGAEGGYRVAASCAFHFGVDGNRGCA